VVGSPGQLEGNRKKEEEGGGRRKDSGVCVTRDSSTPPRDLVWLLYLSLGLIWLSMGSSWVLRCPFRILTAVLKLFVPRWWSKYSSPIVHPPSPFVLPLLSNARVALMAPLAFTHVCADIHVDICTLCSINAPRAEKKRSRLLAVTCRHTLKEGKKYEKRRSGVLWARPEKGLLWCTGLPHAKATSFYSLNVERKDIPGEDDEKNKKTWCNEAVGLSPARLSLLCPSLSLWFTL